MRSWLIRHWYSGHPLLYFLTPFAFLFFCLVKFRAFLYRLGIKKSSQFPVPIIVVGDITIGGTGKTPLIIKIVELLRAKNYKPGIVSRGYGGKAECYPQWVQADSNPRLVGDEAILLAQRTRCPMVVAPERVAAVKMLLEQTDCNIVLSDDGLQHYALARDIEIIVLDGERRLGNGFYLPAGPLRESSRRLGKVDFVVVQGEKRVADEFNMRLLPGVLTNLYDPTLSFPQEHEKLKIHAVAAIGNPERFFAQLRELGFTVTPHIFADHYLFRAQDMDFGQDAIVIMTEKDAVKCHGFADKRHWYLPVDTMVEPEFNEQILKRLEVVGNVGAHH